MLDGFAAHTHGLRVLIERLRGLDDVFVFPAFDAALVSRCALILERSGTPSSGKSAFSGHLHRDCLSGQASNAFSIAASRFTSSSSFANCLAPNAILQ